ncbi:MAG: hypothetical protein OXF27_17895, partial [Acidobacteria bacterium]|nr:hypothetical protein [Acidobacteriota bacterium]
LDYGRTKPSADTKFKVYVPRPIEGRASFFSLEQDSECTYQGPFCILELTITKNQSSVTSDLVIRGQFVWVWKFYHELEISAEKLSGDGGVGWYSGSDRATLEVGN